MPLTQALWVSRMLLAHLGLIAVGTSYPCMATATGAKSFTNHFIRREISADGVISSDDLIVSMSTAAARNNAISSLDNSEDIGPGTVWGQTHNLDESWAHAGEGNALNLPGEDFLNISSRPAMPTEGDRQRPLKAGAQMQIVNNSAAHSKPLTRIVGVILPNGATSTSNNSNIDLLATFENASGRNGAYSTLSLVLPEKVEGKSRALSMGTSTGIRSTSGIALPKSLEGAVQTEPMITSNDTGSTFSDAFAKTLDGAAARTESIGASGNTMSTFNITLTTALEGSASAQSNGIGSASSVRESITGPPQRVERAAQTESTNASNDTKAIPSVALPPNLEGAAQSVLVVRSNVNKPTLPSEGSDSRDASHKVDTPGAQSVFQNHNGTMSAHQKMRHLLQTFCFISGFLGITVCALLMPVFEKSWAKSSSKFDSKERMEHGHVQSPRDYILRQFLKRSRALDRNQG